MEGWLTLSQSDLHPAAAEEVRVNIRPASALIINYKDVWGRWYALSYDNFYVRESVEKNPFFLGQSSKLWVGGGHKS